MTLSAALPAARGPLSEAVIEALGRDERGDFPELPETADADPFGEDLQLALHVCYELHYQGFTGVDPDWEWDPDLLRLRAAMERVFLAALRAHTPGGDDVEEALAPLLVEPVNGTGLSHFLAAEGTWDQVREYFVLRSIYHHKEADPHAWVIPRLRGKPKAALVAVEFDEYGGGRADQVHAQLYADLLDGAGLNSQYLHYLEHAPACMLAVVNMMSLFGLHRRFRAALAGHFAAAEITTAPSAQRMEKALRRLDADDRCRYFYTEHIEADAVHEQVMRRDVLGGLLATEPELAADIVFGIQATDLVEQRFADHVLGEWQQGRSALRKPL
ncbi:iron-containing redox enzyme family protein [Amycolatopsis thermoflava]